MDCMDSSDEVVILLLLVIIFFTSYVFYNQDSTPALKGRWMAAYFGILRPPDYCPFAREESRKMLEFLDRFPNNESATLLIYIAHQSLKSGVLPKVHDQVERTKRANAIYYILCDLYNIQLT